VGIEPSEWRHREIDVMTDSDGWDPDPEGDGTRVRVFDKAFKHWCLENERFNLITSDSDLIQKIKRYPKWQYLKSFRPTGEDRRRRYRVKLKPGVELPEEVTVD
jgi:hypothetical protein